MGNQEQRADLGEADWRWGAHIFSTKGGFMLYGRSFALRVHSRDAALTAKLLSTFGGAAGRVGGTGQWRLAGEQLRSFLQGVRPYLTGQLLHIADDALAKLPPPRALLGAELLSRFALASSSAGGSAAAPLSPEEEPFGRVPSRPWPADQVLFELAADRSVFPHGMLLEAESPGEAAAFAEAASAQPTLRVELGGHRVRLLSNT